MSIKDRNWGRPEEKAVSEPHPDAARNLAYCLDLLKKIEVLEPTLSWEFYDCKTEGVGADGKPLKVISDPKVIIFSWEEGGERWTGDRSFHMPNEEFKKSFCDCINFLLQKRFVKRYGIPIGTIKKKPKYAEESDHKYSSLFGR